MCTNAVGCNKKHHLVVRSKTKPKTTILKEYFGKIANEIRGMFTDPDFIVDLQNIKNVNGCKSFPVDGMTRFEYDVDLDDDMIKNINSFENQLKFEKLGLWIVYDKLINVLRVTLIG